MQPKLRRTSLLVVRCSRDKMTVQRPLESPSNEVVTKSCVGEHFSKSNYFLPGVESRAHAQSIMNEHATGLYERQKCIHPPDVKVPTMTGECSISDQRQHTLALLRKYVSTNKDLLDEKKAQLRKALDQHKGLTLRMKSYGSLISKCGVALPEVEARFRAFGTPPGSPLKNHPSAAQVASSKHLRFGRFSCEETVGTSRKWSSGRADGSSSGSNTSRRSCASGNSSSRRESGSASSKTNGNSSHRSSKTSSTKSATFSSSSSARRRRKPEIKPSSWNAVAYLRNVYGFGKR